MRKHLAGITAVLIAISSVIGLVSLGVSNARAATGNFKLSPSSASVQVGGTLTVKLLINTGGDTATAMSARIKYDPTIFGSPVMTPTSAFPNKATWHENPEPNTIYVDLYDIDGEGVTAAQDVEVATIQLKALKAGSSALTFANVHAPGIGVENPDPAQQNIYVFNPAGATFTVTAAPVASNGTPATGTATARRAQTNTSQQVAATKQLPVSASPPTATDAEPVISDLKISDIGGNTATVSWKTNVLATSSARYGLTDTYGLGAQAEGLATEHSVKLSSTLLRPGLKFMVEATSTDAFGRNAVATTSFTTTAYNVTLRVVNESGDPVSGAEVVLAGKTATTNSSGEAKFTGIPYGSQNVVIKAGSYTTRQSVGVGLGDDGSKLNQLLVVKTQTTMDWVPLAIGGLSLTLLLGLGALVWLYRSSLSRMIGSLRRRPSGPAAATASPSSTPPAAPKLTTVVKPKTSSKLVKTIKVDVPTKPTKDVAGELHLHETPAAPKPGSTFHPSDK